jgi:peroxiredoxin
VELQRVLPSLAAQGVALFAVSYDPVEVLSAFAGKHGITFPLLSDAGSHAMRGLGLVNDRVQEDHAVYGIAANPRHLGVPYPGTFVLDSAGVVTEKRFFESYRERDTGAGLVAAALGVIDGSSALEAADGAVRVSARLDSPTYSFFQRLRLAIEVRVAPGLHVYGQPIPEGYVPLSVEVAPIAGLEAGPLRCPAPHRFRVEGLDDEFWVHEGTIRGALPLTFTGAPGSGDQIVRVTVSYQACSTTTCLPPAAATFALPVREVALVDRALPSATRTQH